MLFPRKRERKRRETQREKYERKQKTSFDPVPLRVKVLFGESSTLETRAVPNIEQLKAIVLGAIKQVDKIRTFTV